MGAQHVDLKIRISKGLKVLLDELAETDYFGSGVNDVVRAILQEGVGRHIAQMRELYQDAEKLRDAKRLHVQSMKAVAIGPNSAPHEQ